MNDCFKNKANVYAMYQKDKVDDIKQTTIKCFEKCKLIYKYMYDVTIKIQCGMHKNSHDVKFVYEILDTFRASFSM